MSDKPEIRKMEFVFARIHFEGLFSQGASKKLKEFLMKSEEKTIEEGRFSWAFGDVDSLEIKNNEIIFGRLGRTVTEKFETIYDGQTHSYRKELIKSNIAAYSNFFIFPELSILAMEEKYNLSKNKLIKKFKEFWKKTGNIVDIDFEFLKSEVRIFELIKSWDLLTEASFKLFPSNPKSDHIWKEVDEMIRKAKAKRAKLKFENKENGLAKEDSIVQKSMSMASDGYGEFNLRGLKGNVGQSISSISLIIKREIHNIDDLKTILGQIYEEVTKILGKKKSNE